MCVIVIWVLLKLDLYEVFGNFNPENSTPPLRFWGFGLNN